MSKWDSPMHLNQLEKRLTKGKQLIIWNEDKARRYVKEFIQLTCVTSAFPRQKLKRLPSWRLVPFKIFKMNKKLYRIQRLSSCSKLALYLIQDKELPSLIILFKKKSDLSRFSLYDDFKVEELNTLREITKKVKLDGKLMYGL